MFPINLIKGIVLLVPRTLYMIGYFFFIGGFLILKFLTFLTTKLPFLKGLRNAFYNLLVKLDGVPDNSISRIELIELAYANIKVKKTRTFITVGGMAVGISAIVFLVSIGFGIQSLVVTKVARAEELRQIEVSTAPKTNLFINDELIKTFKDFPNVNMVLPQIAVVGKVNYNNSSTDVAVYGVTKDYLEQSAISPVSGKIFESNDIESTLDVTTTTVLDDPTDLTEVRDEILVGDWVEVEDESNMISQFETTKVVLPESLSDKDAVVNRAFLKLLGIDEKDAIDKVFKVAFIASGNLVSGELSRIESTETEYRIIGITLDESTPFFYVPFVHLKSLGIQNYSLLKVVVNSEEKLVNVRNLIEAQGFNTSSVVDTIKQINNLFDTTRTILAALGTVALLVASLGMFNTLTVSLLERTREIGLLKAMGMKSKEIRDSFLAESMIMGSFGGFFGLLLGFIMGKILEFALSMIAVNSGSNAISIIEVPFFFIIMIIFLSFFVGVLTGLYPARRATKISALNALRYE